MKILKTTVIGGLLFLVPIVILVMILGKAHAITMRVAAPLAAWIPVDAVGGLLLADLLAGVAIVTICFVAGLAARSSAVVRAVESMESGFLSAIPGYAFVKGMIASLAGTEEAENLRPVLVRFDDSWQVAFEVERSEDGRVVVYVPGAPDPRSGAVLIVTADRVDRIAGNLASVVKSIRAIGRGTPALLKGPSKEATGQ